MKTRKLIALLFVLMFTAMMAVTVGAADETPLETRHKEWLNTLTTSGVTLDSYVLGLKEELLFGNKTVVVLERDIELDGRYVQSAAIPVNGNGKYYTPGIFNVVGTDKNVTFDLNGHTITYRGHEELLVQGTYTGMHLVMKSSCSLTHALFFANNGGKLTIIDSVGTGKVIVNGNASAVTAASPNSVITVDGGTWLNKPCETCKKTGSFLYTYQGGELYIKDGVFSQEYDPTVQDESDLILFHGGEFKNSTGEIRYEDTVAEFSGGRFIGMNPAAATYYRQTAGNTLEDGGTISVVADGCMSFDNGDGSYTIAKPCSVSTAVTPADADVTVTNYYGKVIAPGADGTYTLATGEKYTCSASHADYEPASVEFTAADQGVVKLDLERIPEPEETNPTMLLFLKLYLRKFTVTATAGEGGTITPEGETSYHYSRKNIYTYTITPDEGYVIADVLLDGESIGAVESYDFIQLKKDHTIEAIFEKAAE